MCQVLRQYRGGLGLCQGRATPIKMVGFALFPCKPIFWIDFLIAVHSIFARTTDDLALLLIFKRLPGCQTSVLSKDSNTIPQSPLKKTLRSSIRPYYAQLRGYSKRSTRSDVASRISASTDPLQCEPIASWPVLIAAVSPAKELH